MAQLNMAPLAGLWQVHCSRGHMHALSGLSAAAQHRPLHVGQVCRHCCFSQLTCCVENSHACERTAQTHCSVELQQALVCQHEQAQWATPWGRCAGCVPGPRRPAAANRTFPAASH